MDFWELPGPRSFVDEIFDHLSDGNSLVLRLPAFGPADVARVVRERVGHYHSWADVQARAELAPEVLLTQEFACSDEDRAAPSVKHLVESVIPRGMVVWVEGIDAESWDSWCRFIERFADVARNQSSSDRPVLVLCVSGEAALRLPGPEIALACMDWRGRVSEFDMLLYAAHGLRKRDMPRRMQRVVAHLIAQVALWDRDAADRLLDERTEQILDPAPVLRALAADRGWTSVTQRNWATGTLDDVEGRESVHSALVALDGRSDEIAQRLWAAQAAVILPALEKQRREILAVTRPHLRVPFNTDAGRIDRVEDLEIGHIWYQLRERKLDQRLLRRVERIRDARNCLAHLEPLRAAWLLAEDPSVL